MTEKDEYKEQGKEMQSPEVLETLKSIRGFLRVASIVLIIWIVLQVFGILLAGIIPVIFQYFI